MRITDEHLDQLRREGYTVVERFLEPGELAVCRAECERLFPSPQQYALAPQLFDNYPTGGVAFDPPFLGTALNLVAAHPDLSDFAERALGTTDLILSRATAWAKFGAAHDFNQAMHLDYMADTLLVPAPRATPEQVTAILYYVDVEADLGPTCLVPRSRLREATPLVPYLRPREQYPELYEREQPIIVPAGSLLLYDLCTFHRGSAVTRRAGVRLTHHFAYRRSDANWVGSMFWGNYGLSAEMQQLLERATPRQRALFGVPLPGHAYWNEETIAGMAARYPGMDMTPYVTAANTSHRPVVEAREHLAQVAPPKRFATSTGVASAMDNLRAQVDQLCAHVPPLAAYWTGVFDFYEMTAAMSPRRGSDEERLSWIAS